MLLSKEELRSDLVPSPHDPDGKTEAQRGDNLPMVTWLVGTSWGTASRGSQACAQAPDRDLRVSVQGDPGAKSGFPPVSV